MISTSNYSSLPERSRLQQICKAISVADSILSQEWQYRYYSYNSKWSDGQEFCGMRNGHGDEMLILFLNEGCVINGMAHEYYPKNKDNLTNGLPKVYHEFIFGEPVHSTGTTFCLWTTGGSKWKTAELENYDDGSEDLLKSFNDNPQTYIDWAARYYEDDFIVNANSHAVISQIYSGATLTKDMVLALNAKLDDWKQLIDDLVEINYTFQFE
jgi:hypothetical protein